MLGRMLDIRGSETDALHLVRSWSPAHRLPGGARVNIYTKWREQVERMKLLADYCIFQVRIFHAYFTQNCISFNNGRHPIQASVRNARREEVFYRVPLLSWPLWVE
jgi:hypothetical protein